MANLKRLERSNNAHARLFRKQNKIFRDEPFSSKKYFWASVKHEYHYNVYKEQMERNQILPKWEKSDIYDIAITKVSNKRNFHNSFGEKNYVPKKYR